MSYINQISINPHIYLYAESLTQKQENKNQMRKIEVLSKTRLFDQLLEETDKLKDLQFSTLKEQIQKAKVQSEAQKKELGVDTIFEIIEKVQKDSNKQEVDSQQLDKEQEKIYKLAKILFDEGDYEKSYKIILKLESQILNDSLYVRTTWARLYCQIMLKKDGRRTAERLKNKIDEIEEEQNKYEAKQSGNKKNASLTRKQFAQKEDFLNLVPFVYFRENMLDEDFEKFLDISTNKTYFPVTQLLCPYLLRYICASMILNKTLQKNRSFDLWRMTQAIQRKYIKYTDSLVDFIRSLYIEYDFQSAKDNINRIKEEIKQDVLFKGIEERLIANCYYLYYKVYCKMHDKVEIQSIAKVIGKTEEEAQLWILGMIRSYDIEAKIDSEQGTIVTFREQQTINEKYIDVLPKMSAFISNLTQAKQPK